MFMVLIYFGQSWQTRGMSGNAHSPGILAWFRNSNYRVPIRAFFFTLAAESVCYKGVSFHHDTGIY